MNDIDLIRFSALLHDIGKFWQGTGEKGDHQELSAKFIRMYLPEKLEKATFLAGHHDTSQYKSKGYKLLKILVCADWLSAGERRELKEDEEKGKRKNTPLRSIFSQINIEKGKRPSEHYLSLGELKLDGNTIFPKPLGKTKGNWLQDDYKKIWDKFVDEVKKINISDFDSYFNTLYYLLQKYTWCVPSAVWKDVPDISLFDHLKTTCAIAECLYKSNIEERELDNLINAIEKSWKGGELNDEEKRILNDDKFVLIGGDISGIQKFIYAVSMPEEAREGMARRLRGRSFYLTLLNDAIATYILSTLKLSQTSLLWCGSGHFTILAMNTESTIHFLEKIKKHINTSLLRIFGGSLALALKWIKVSPKELGDFGALREVLSNEINEEKKKKFMENLSVNFFRPISLPTNKLCAVCNMPSEGAICNKCRDHEKMGRKIARANYLLKIEGSNLKKCDMFAFETGYSFIESKEKIAETLEKIGGEISNIHILKLNDTNFLERDIFSKMKGKFPISFGFSFLGNTVPLHLAKNSILDFEAIANLSKGTGKIGVLKMDLDNLGRIFAEGLSKENRTMSRISTMSSMLDLFFGGYINNIAKRHYVYANLCNSCLSKLEKKKRDIEIEITEKGEKKRIIVYKVEADFEKEICNECKSERNRISEIYTIYSGGDDLLMVGPWDVIIETARDIRGGFDGSTDGFKEFVCNNESINMSAGISIIDPKFSIGRGISIADDYLKIAKSHLKDAEDEDMKNSISLFNECVCWDNLPGYQKKGFNSLFDLAIYLEGMYEKNEISKSFIYSLLKMWENTFIGLNLSEIEKKRIIRKKYMPYLKYAMARTFRDEKKREEVENMIKPFMPWIRIPVSWVSLRTR